jgi:hypothetical protein
MVAGVVLGFCLSFFFKWLFQKFFISLSVRPGNLAAMADHLQMKEHQKHQMLSHKLYV